VVAPAPAVVQESAPAPEQTEDAPRSQTAPVALGLMPSEAAPNPGREALFPGQQPLLRPGPSRGLTLHPGDLAVQPESRVAAARRAQENVQGFAEDVLADARAGSGINPYFEAVGQALASELRTTDGGTPVQLGVTDANAGVKLAYQTAASNYGRTGDPGAPPPGRAPLPTESMGVNAPMMLRMQAQAVESQQVMNAIAPPLFSVKLELRQSPRGELTSMRLAELSGNPLFDAFVEKVVLNALKKVAVEPPPRALELRSLYRVDGWLKKTLSVEEEVARSLPGANLIAPFVDQLAVVDPKLSTFDYRVTLLRAY
jgi:hypothetical protein